MSGPVLLISNSTQYGHGYLDHAEPEIRSVLQNVKRVLFVPYALKDMDGYAEMARKRFAAMGYELEPIHRAADPRAAVASTEAIFIGGGNTFRLLKAIYDNGVRELIHDCVKAGMPYIGSSAGSNVAGPTIKTTKDMPIVQPPSFDAIGLVPFQISPHFQDPDPSTRHMGETQEERIVQFLEENDLPVCGLREGGMVLVNDGVFTLKGANGARIFRRGHAPVEARPGERVDALLRGKA